MNERIRELAELATLYTSDVCYPDDPDWHETRDQRFAELIVRECADICEDEDDGSIDTKSVRLAMIRIKKHFGD
jgi:hypothetical protein